MPFWVTNIQINQTVSYPVNEANICNKSELKKLVCKKLVVSTRSIVSPTSALRKPAQCYSETRSRSNFIGA